MDFKEIANQNKILEARTGSHLFGTDTPDSDLDLFGIFMPCEEMIYGFQRCEEVDLGTVIKDDTGRNTPEAIDFKLHEYRKFVRLALQNNPNILHVLFVNHSNIRFINDFGISLLDQAHKFPHKGAYHRFIKYAEAQLHKMNIKPENYTKLENGLEILLKEDDYKVIAELKNVSPFQYQDKGKHVKLGDINFEAGTYIKKARKMVKERLNKATNRVQLFTKYGYDVKFGSNLIQLLMEGIELMQTGTINMPLGYKQHILDIKTGMYTVEEIIAWAQDLKKTAGDAYDKSKLPESPPTKEIERFTIDQVKTFLNKGTSNESV